MKAIRVENFGEPEVLQYVDLPDPQISEKQILVRLHAVGVNPVETYIRAGTYARLPSLPFTPGSDGAGVVEAVGREIDTVKVGDRVFVTGSISGTYAEIAICEPEKIYPLPANATFAQGAALGVPYATAHRGLFGRGGAKAGETLLIHGASGGVGTAAVQLARAAGLRVFGTAGSPEGIELLLKLGVEHAFNHRDPDYQKAILDATNGRGVDCILEMLANINLANDLRLLSLRGRVVVVGNRGSIEINPRDAMARDADIRGLVLPNTPAAELAAIYRSLSEDLASGGISPIIGREFPLADAAEAHRAVLLPNARGKIVLTP